MDNNQDQLAHQQEMLRDLQTKLSQSSSEDEKRSIQLKMNVVNAKIAQLQNDNSGENVSEDTIKQDSKWVNKGEEGTHGEFDTKKAADDQRKAMFANGYTEEAPYQKTHFLDEDKKSDVYNIRQQLEHARKMRDKTRSKMANNKEEKETYKNWDMHVRELEKKLNSLNEGCMTKKFENMTNREIAKYIFGHPHTKFAGKMKECDDKEILKAILDIKKTNEEAPVTNTSAVANSEAPSMYMKRKIED